MRKPRSAAQWTGIALACVLVGVAWAARLGIAAQALHTPKLGPGATLDGRRPFPDDSPWNRDVSRLAVDPRSATLIASIGIDRPLHPDFGSNYQGHPMGIPYVVISGAQAKTQAPVTFENTDESDAGPYPIPADAPIEGGPDSDGDRHVIVVDRDNWKLYELFAAVPDRRGGFSQMRWKAYSGAIFDLSTGADRPAGFTSADAAGLPIFPGLVRYDEAVERKEIAHALRFTCRHSRRAYVSPARHFASRSQDESLPPMGMRVRLKAGVDTSSFPPTEQVIVKALKKYGMILADNGGDWYVSGAPDPRWNNDELASLKRLKGSDFEVVRMGELVTR